MADSVAHQDQQESSPAVAPLLLRVFLLFLMCMAVLLIVVGGWSRSTARQDAEQKAAQLTRLVQSQTARMFEAADILLIYMTDIAEATDWSDPVAAAGAQDKLHQLRTALPYVWQLWIMDRSGSPRASTMNNVAGVNIADRDYFQVHKAGDRGLFISTPFRGAVSGQIVFVLSRRFIDNGEFDGVAVLSLNPDELANYYRSLDAGAATIFQLIGADGAILAQDPPLPEDQQLTARAAPDLAAAIEHASSGTLTGIFSTDGVQRSGAFRRLDTLPLTVAIGTATGWIDADWIDRTKPFFLFSLASLAALSVLSLVTVRRARGEDRARMELVEAKEHLEERIAERTASLTEALKQKDMLFKELNHRVKNNLQLITSFVSLQAKRVNDPAAKDGFQACLNRIRSVGVVHELLYRTDSLDEVDFGTYLNELCRRLTEALGEAERIVVTVDADRTPIDVDKAIPLALIVNELFANALKHAFPADRRGTIAVTWRSHAAASELTVADDGVGMPETTGQHTTLGLHLVTILVRQLGAALEREPVTRGTVLRIRIPARSTV